MFCVIIYWKHIICLLTLQGIVAGGGVVLLHYMSGETLDTFGQFKAERPEPLEIEVNIFCLLP